METHTFSSGGSKLSATVRSSGKERRPGIVVVGSWTTVQEQMPKRYAELLADAGLATMTFDFRGFGKSEGTPREVESARSKAEDILNAAAYLQTLDGVDPARIGVLAVCASASYTALAVQGAQRATSAIQSIALVAPWIHDAAIVEKLYGGKDAVAERLRQARDARNHYAAAGEVAYVKAASNTDKTAAMYAPGDELDYYLNPRRGAVPEWGGRFAVMAWTEWLQADFVALAAHVHLPLAVVTGEKTATPSGAKDFVKGLPDRATVSSHAGTQFDFYDDPKTVEFAAARAVEHFQASLGGAR